MKTSSNGRQFIEGFEGLSLKAYYDSVHVLTIGYGHTNLGNIPPHVVPGMVITKPEADEALENDLSRFEAAVANIMHGVNLTQCQFDALVSFDFNTGDLASSSIPSKLRAGQTKAAMATLLEYNHAAGRVLAGLTRRRAGEKLMFLGEVSAALKLAEA